MARREDFCDFETNRGSRICDEDMADIIQQFASKDMTEAELKNKCLELCQKLGLDEDVAGDFAEEMQKMVFAIQS